MSVTRRQFLLSTAGASVGAIIPSFYFRALEFFEQFGEPLLEAPRLTTQDLCVVDNCGEYLELTLGDPFADFPPMTYREYFIRCDPDGFDRFESDWGLEPEDLDSELPEEFRWDVAFIHSRSLPMRNFLMIFSGGYMTGYHQMV